MQVADYVVRRTGAVVLNMSCTSLDLKWATIHQDCFHFSIFGALEQGKSYIQSKVSRGPNEKRESKFSSILTQAFLL